MENKRRPTKLKKPSVYPDSQSGRWICDYEEIVEGVKKHRRRKFKTEKDAAKKRGEVQAKQKKVERKIAGTSLTTAQALQAQWLFAELERLPWKGVTLAVVMDHFKLTYWDRGAAPLSKAVSDFKEYKRKSGIKKSTYKDIPPRLGKLAAHFDGRSAGELTADDFIDFVAGQLPGMRYKYYVLVREFLDYSSHEGRDDAVFPRKLLATFSLETKNGDRFKLESNAAPTILHVDEVRNGLATCLEFKVGEGVPGEWLGCFVLGTYCGLRSHEIQAIGRIQRGQYGVPEKPDLYQDYGKLGEDAVWAKHIQLRKKQIVCDEKIGTKTKERRNVDIQENVLEWLKLIKERRLPLCPGPRRYSRLAKYFRIAVMDEKRQGDKKWNDVFRHTFATFLKHKVGMAENEYMRQLGHAMDVARKNYLGNMYDGESSEQFFSIYPRDLLRA